MKKALFDLRSRSDRSSNRKERLGGGVGARTLSVGGAAALLLLLFVVPLIPQGAILAMKERLAPLLQASSRALMPVLPASPAYGVRIGYEGGPTATVTSSITTTIATSGAPAAPPVHDDCFGCISGYIIDLYEQPAGARWPVTVTPLGGGTPIAVTADALGRFQIPTAVPPGLCPGQYRVELDVPDCWRPVTPASFSVTLTGNETGCVKVRFKVEALPSLEVIKLDVDGDVGIPDWAMTASNGTTTKTSKTDGTGRAYFYCLESGVWNVTEESKVGWEAAIPPGPSQNISLESPRQPGFQTLVFRNYQVHTAGIHVRKLDSAGAPLVGWKIDLIRNDGTQAPAAAYTDSGGNAWFAGLALGEWTVRENMQPWYRPEGPVEQVVNLTVPGYYEEVVFTNEPLGCVDGKKINHLGDGLAGWTIYATNDFTGEQLKAVTDATGYFQFMGLSLDTWTISEELQPGWESVTPSEFQVDVRTPFVCQQVRFKNRTPYACLDVYKIDSTDGAGIAGWQITVQPAYGGAAISGETDGTGWVRFSNLAPGVYNVAETIQAPWIPDSPPVVMIELQASGTCGVVVFQNHQKTADVEVFPPAPPKEDPAPSLKDPAPSKTGCRLRHTVRAGDTLLRIARRYGTSALALMRANHLRDPDLIYIGQTFCIP